MRGKIARLEEALGCAFVTGEHAAGPAMMLATTGYSTARIGELTAKTGVLGRPDEHRIARLDAVPGTGVLTAQDIIAETGTGMTVFPAPAWSAGRNGAPRPPSAAASAREPTPPAAATAPSARPPAKPPSPPAAPSPPRRDIPPPGQADAREQSPRRHRQLPADHLPRPAL
jgi:hypothetical protein